MGGALAESVDHARDEAEDQQQREDRAHDQPEDGPAPAVLLSMPPQIADGQQPEYQGHGRGKDEHGEEARVAGGDCPGRTADGQEHRIRHRRPAVAAHRRVAEW